MELRLRHRSSGNVRELEKVIERAVVLADSDVIRAEDLPPPLQGLPENAPPPRRGRSPAGVENVHILATLYRGAQAGGHFSPCVYAKAMARATIKRPAPIPAAPTQSTGTVRTSAATASPIKPMTPTRDAGATEGAKALVNVL